MRSCLRLIVALVLALAAALVMPLSAQSTARVHGVVSDGTGGVLPGVTVNATSADGHVLGSAVTDAVGRYVIESLPAMTVSLTFELEGFATEERRVTLAPGGTVDVGAKLGVGGHSETVEVVGKVPEVPRLPPLIVPPPPPPPPATQPVPEHDPDSVCGPAKPDASLASFGTVRARRDGRDNGLYSKGDQLVIDGGTLAGIAVGDNFAVRRIYRVNDIQRRFSVEHTAGLLQIVSADEHESLAIVVYACDALMRGDELAAFKPEPLRTPDPFGAPAYDNAARILFADVGQMLGVTGRLMVIDRGLDSDIHVGQALTIFRRRDSGKRTPSVVGDAVVVAVRGDSATIRVVNAVDEISFGDLAAPQRYRSLPKSVASITP